MRLESYSPAILPAIVRFWNRAFAAKRNFFPVTEQLFRSRVVEKGTAVERFDPGSFVAAREGEEVVGIIHVGVRPEALCLALDPEWPGGTQGYVAFVYVEPDHRRKGIGSALWARGIDLLRSTRQVVLDGQCVNPFYGNSEGPFTPFWGTPEGVSVEYGDSATKKALARKGFAPRYKGIQLALEFSTHEPPSPEIPERSVQRSGVKLEYLASRYPVLGKPLGELRPVAPWVNFDCVAAVKRGKVVGLICSYPMKEVRRGLHAIYEAGVVRELRGKALGKHLLAAALARMRNAGAESCEVLTLPDLSPAAPKLYASAGFKQAASWAVY